MNLISTYKDSLQNIDLYERFVVFSENFSEPTDIQGIQHVQIDIDINAQNAQYVNDGQTNTIEPYKDNNKLAFYIDNILSKDYDYSYWNKETHTGVHTNIQDIYNSYNYNKYEEYNNIRLQNINTELQKIKELLNKDNIQHILTQNILLDYTVNQNNEYIIDRYYRSQDIEQFKDIIEEIINPTTNTTQEA